MEEEKYTRFAPHVGKYFGDKCVWAQVNVAEKNNGTPMVIGCAFYSFNLEIAKLKLKKT